MQLAYPVLSPWSFMGTISIIVVGICLFVLAVRLAERFSPRRPIWTIAKPFLHVGDFIALAYIACGVLLYLNGLLETSSPQKHFAEVLTVTEEPLQLGRWAPAGRVELAVQNSDSSPQYLFVDARTLDRILPGQGISMVTYGGRFGVPWVDRFTVQPDYKSTATILFAKGVNDPVFARLNIKNDLASQQFKQAYKKAQPYLAQEPGDILLAIDLAEGAFRAGQSALAVQILEPFVSQHYNYKLYCSFGHYLRTAGDTQKGIDYFKAAVGMDPEYPEAYYLLGHTYKSLGYKEESRVAFARLVELQPQYAYLLAQ